VAELHNSGVKIKIVGSRDDLEPGMVSLLDDAERLTQENSKLNLVVAFNYGSRQEISRAMSPLQGRSKAAKSPRRISLRN